MLISLWSKGRPRFGINKVDEAIFIVMFSYVFVRVEIFEYSSLHRTFYFECELPAKKG
jgi:hypothetical protein